MKLVLSILAVSMAAVTFGEGVASATPRRIKTLGYMLDVSRSKVPKMETFRRMVDILARLGYNQFQLYTEHTFAYSKHRTVWCEASPMMPDEIRELDGYCAAHGIELVPNQNSFGHLEHWLKHPEYNELAECPTAGTYYKKWGYRSTRAMALCPTDPRSVPFLAGLYDELFPCFRSKLVNVGCDETIELLDDNNPLTGRSTARIKEIGPHRVYIEFLKEIHALVAARGHRMMFWGDIVLQRPELVTELPRDLIALDWGYEDDHPFDKETAAFEKAGIEFYVCPGTSTWCALVGRTPVMLANIDRAVRAGEEHGAAGLLLTDWGDTGHPHPWIVSIPALVYASCRVKGENPDRAELAKRIDGLVGCRCGEALLRMGDVCRISGASIRNVSQVDALLRGGKHYKRPKGMTDETLAAAMAEWRSAEASVDLDGASDWVKDGFRMTALLRAAVEDRIADPGRPNFRAMFEPRYRELWLKYNRRGGLERSLNSVFGL